MRKLLATDTFRLFHSKWFWLCIDGMLTMSVAFIIMQHTAMDYEVPLSRVIFLPMSFYGVTLAALISLFVGEDFSDGFIRNKIIAGHSRYSIFASNLIISWLACVVIYCSITMLCGNKVTATVLCMGLAFLMLFACLHTNQIMVQPEYKNGVLNPAYVDGFAKNVYAVLHDLNPSGQAAQLSAMEAFHPIRWFFCDLGWVVATGVGMFIFKRNNIQ